MLEQTCRGCRKLAVEYCIVLKGPVDDLSLWLMT